MPLLRYVYFGFGLSIEVFTGMATASEAMEESVDLSVTYKNCIEGNGAQRQSHFLLQALGHLMKSVFMQSVTPSVHIQRQHSVYSFVYSIGCPASK